MTAVATPSARLDDVIELIRAGRVDEAEVLARACLAAHPDDADVLNVLGGIARMRGEGLQAAGFYREALAKRPDFVKAMSNLGAVLIEAGHHDEAIVQLSAALARQPDFVDARVNLGTALLNTGRYVEAETELGKALDTAAGDALAWNSLGNARFHLGKLDQAIAAFEQAIAIDPRLVMAQNNLGTAWREKGNYSKAETAYRSAIAIDGRQAEAWSGLGVLLREQGRFTEAFTAQEHALSIKPTFRMAQFARGLISLGEGRFGDGFRDYLARDMTDVDGLCRDPLPADLTGRRLLLLADQGFGDELFFLRFAPMLKRRGARLTYQGSAAIAAIVERSAAVDEVVTEGESPHDLKLSIGDLPHLLGMTSTSDVPSALKLPVRKHDREAVEATLEKFGPPPYVGLTWRAGTRQWNALTKSVPVAQLGRALSGISATFIVLQRDPDAGEIEALSASLGRPVHDLSSLNKNLERMLALLHRVEAYVGVSNTNTHLRAGTSRPSHVLVSHPPEWRWMNRSERSPWFSTFPLYRQKFSVSDDGWQEALAMLRRDLDAFLTKGAP